MRIANIQNKTLLYAIVFALMFCTVFFAVQDFAYIAFADDDVVGFDNTNVLDDLESSTVNGKPFDFLEYAFDETKSLQIINLVEYCYSYKANMRGNYGLYVYVYNPQGIDIVEKSGQNKIEMAVSWSKNDDGSYSANQYEKFNLKFCNKSERANYKGLFYKFKIVDKEIDGKTMAERVNSAERRYDVVGVELLTRGNTNATDYGVGGSYRYSGYAQGYGDSDESTLNCVVEDFETLSLEVHHTYYRTNVSSLGKGHYNEVNTVYFSIPDRIFTQYGNLQKIHAEWWEYKTKMAFITSNGTFYDWVYANRNYELSHNADTSTLRLYDKNVSYYITADNTKYYGGTNVFGWSYNYEPYYGTQTSSTSKVNCRLLPLVFYSTANDMDSLFSFLYSKQVAGAVESSVVADYIYNYKNDLGHGYLDCNGRQISKDLFEDEVDDGRTMGYNNCYIDLADTFNLDSYDSNHTWWNKLWDYGFSWPSTDGDYQNVAPIYELTDNDFLKDNDTFANDLLVNKDDVNSLRTYYSQEKLKGNHVILFRFANTDYYAEEATRTIPADNYDKEKDYTDSYIAQMTCFFDFDIIDLTFNKDGVYTVIPVVSSPVDIINGFDPPATEFEWWKLILMILALILFLILLAPVLPYILKGIVWIVSLPFKAVGKIVKSVKGSKRTDSSSGVTAEDLNSRHSKSKKKIVRGKNVETQKKKE